MRFNIYKICEYGIIPEILAFFGMIPKLILMVPKRLSISGGKIRRYGI